MMMITPEMHCHLCRLHKIIQTKRCWKQRSQELRMLFSVTLDCQVTMICHFFCHYFGIAKLSLPTDQRLSSSIFPCSSVRPYVRPASVTSPLVSTVWCLRSNKPYIFCLEMILAICQQHPRQMQRQRHTQRQIQRQTQEKTFKKKVFMYRLSCSVEHYFCVDN